MDSNWLITNKLIVGAGVIVVILLSIFGCLTLFFLFVEQPSPIVEGELIIYTSIPTTIIEEIKEDFTKDYPQVNLEIIRNGTTNILSRIYDDINETGQVQGDLIWVADFANSEELKSKGVFQKYQSPEQENVIFIFTDSQGYYTGTRLLSMVVVYNTDKIDDPPSDYSDLLDSKWKDEVGIPNPLTGGSAFYTVSTLALNEEIGWKFFEKLYENGCQIIKNNRVLIEEISNGNLSIGFALDYSVRNALHDNSSLPLDYIYPKKGTVVISSPIGISKDCKDVETAKVFIDWVISKKGQEVMTRLGIGPVRSDVEVPAGMIALDQLKVLPSNPKEFFEKKEEILNNFTLTFNITDNS